MRFSYNLSSEIPELFNVLSTTSMPIPTSNYFTVSEYSTKSNDKYRIARYNKDILLNDLIPSYGLLRSVIFNKYNQIVSFAPPKSSLADQFIKKYATKFDVRNLNPQYFFSFDIMYENLKNNSLKK